ncbi:MAG: UDP-N-acetylmuramate dehydrogenase [Chitinispirillales bacterium]|jgi:UDP-N-acetylmuramate dehydrogenase|nr:UDP-N-acetylmuramate dehydrogenase [Chitinispirillales bacterium]
MKILENITLADKTSYKIGGRARFYIEPESEDEIIEAHRFAAERGVSVFILGNGSNLLISDNGINAVVINLAARFSKIEWDGLTAVASGGFLLDDLAADAAKRGATGIVELSGIPGTIGGAVIMNAGAFDADIAKTLQSARIFRASSQTFETVAAADLALSYRSSSLKGGMDVVISATFEFETMVASSPSLTREKILAARNEKQPLDYPSCGSVFKRPPGNYAGTLIQSCNLKGFKIGGAMVSDKHANFIINTGNATAEDVRSVIRHVQKTVYENSEILLEPEVIFVGEFNEPLFTL